MITTGFTLAILTGCGFYLVYRKLPASCRSFMQKHPLLTDAIACLSTYMLFGGTLVALFAAAWLGVIVSLMLAITSNPALNAMLERWVQKINKIKEDFVKWAASKTPQQPETPQLKVVQEEPA